MTVVAKMSVSSVEDFGMNKRIKLGCQYDSGINTGDDPENKSFTKATPWGECAMSIDNPYAADQFKLAGKNEDGTYTQASTHYVLFIDASKNSLQDVMVAAASLT